MDKSQTITINNELDIIEARMRVRTLARETGLDLFDQARISLATSTLAIILGLEKGSRGSVGMTQLHAHDRVGVQVICIRHDTSPHDLTVGVLDDARRMVDEMQVSQPSGGGVAVTVVKWAGRARDRIDIGRPLRADDGGN
ncbi:MAG: hypothetical protein ACK2U9_09535 [Anaerolineae bacterium]|jgi:hypothetical protein